MASELDLCVIQRYLSIHALFSNLSVDERTRLIQGCGLRRHARGEMIFRMGDACNAFHIVVSGQVKLYVSSLAGQEKVIRIIGPEHSFAEAMMFLEKPYVLNVKAIADTVLMSVSKDAVFNEIALDPRFTMRMLAGMSRRMVGLVQDLESNALRSGAQRLIGYLLRDIEAHEPVTSGIVTVTLPVSKAVIASRLSLTPEYFSRVMHELEAEGLIEIDKRDIRISDVQRLTDYYLI